MIRKIFTISILSLGLCTKAPGKGLSYSERMAATAMTIWKDSLATADGKPVKWSYDQAVVLKGIEVMGNTLLTCSKAWTGS